MGANENQAHSQFSGHIIKISNVITNEIKMVDNSSVMYFDNGNCGTVINYGADWLIKLDTE